MTGQSRVCGAGQVSRGCRAVSRIIPLCPYLSPLIQLGGSQVTAASIYPVSLSLGLKSIQSPLQLFAKPEAPGLTLFHPVPSVFLFRQFQFSLLPTIRLFVPKSLWQSIQVSLIQQPGSENSTARGIVSWLRAASSTASCCLP